MKRNQTAVEIMEEIETLRKKADDAKRAEIPGVVDRMKKAIEFYGLTASDLGFNVPGQERTVSTSTAAADAPQRKSLSPSTPIKYRDGAGNGWSGRGPKNVFMIS